MASIVSGASFLTVVIRGCKERAGETIDTGKIRTPGNLADMADVQRPDAAAAAANILYYYENGHLDSLNNTSLRLRKIDLVDFLLDHPAIQESAVYMGSNGIGRFLAPSTAVFLHYVFSEKNRELAGKFFDQLSSGADLHSRHPILILRDKLVDLKSQLTRRGRADRIFIIALVIKAWNAFVAKRQMRVLRWNRKEAFPQVSKAS